MSLPIPDADPLIQTAIADYLDAETARIDALIAKKQQLIDLLEERRRQQSNMVVTVGTESRQLVNTGHDFAPLVPVGWRLMRLRHLVEEIVDTEHATVSTVDRGAYAVVRTANVKDGELRLDDALRTDVDGYQKWTRRGVPSPGDVFFTREAPAGEACVVPPSPQVCMGQRMVLLKLDQSLVMPDWLVHSIYSGPAQVFIEYLSRSTTVAHINMSDIPDIPIVLPPITEQAQLLRALTATTGALRKAEAVLERQLALLAERRQALITAAVTGELDIPWVAA